MKKLAENYQISQKSGASRQILHGLKDILISFLIFFIS